MSKLVCGSKEAALSALDALVESMEPGTPREAIKAVAVWIKEKTQTAVMTEEEKRLMLSIFEEEPKTQVKPKNATSRKTLKMKPSA
jgi:hypothetical protein